MNTNTAINNSFVNMILKFLKGDIPLKMSVEDIVLNKAITTKSAQINSNKYKNKLLKTFENGKITIAISEKDAPKFAFQDILNVLRKENPNTLIFLGSHIETRLTKDDIEEYKLNNKIPPKTKKILKLFLGSTHKPFDEDFSTTLTIPCDTNNLPIIDDILETKLNDIFNYYNLFCTKTKVITPFIDNPLKDSKTKKIPLLSFVLLKRDNSSYARELQKNLTLADEKEIRDTFSKLTPFEKLNSKIIITLFYTIFMIVAVTQLFNFINTDNSEDLSKNKQEVQAFVRKSTIAERKKSLLNDEVARKENMITNKMRTYKGN